MTKKSCIYCFYISNCVDFKNWLIKRIILHIHPGFNVFYLKFMLFEHLVQFFVIFIIAGDFY